MKDKKSSKELGFVLQHFITVSMNYFKEKENKSDSAHMVQLMNIVFSSQRTCLSQVLLHNLLLLFLL